MIDAQELVLEPVLVQVMRTIAVQALVLENRTYKNHHFVVRNYIEELELELEQERRRFVLLELEQRMIAEVWELEQGQHKIGVLELMPVLVLPLVSRSCKSHHFVGLSDVEGLVLAQEPVKVQGQRKIAVLEPLLELALVLLQANRSCKSHRFVAQQGAEILTVAVFVADSYSVVPDSCFVVSDSCCFVALDCYQSQFHFEHEIGQKHKLELAHSLSVVLAQCCLTKSWRWELI